MLPELLGQEAGLNSASPPRYFLVCDHRVSLSAGLESGRSLVAGAATRGLPGPHRKADILPRKLHIRYELSY